MAVTGPQQPEQPEQQYDENTNRVALQRHHGPDAQYAVPLNMELAAFSPGTVNVVVSITCAAQTSVAPTRASIAASRGPGATSRP